MGLGFGGLGWWEGVSTTLPHMESLLECTSYRGLVLMSGSGRCGSLGLEFVCSERTKLPALFFSDFFCPFPSISFFNSLDLLTLRTECGGSGSSDSRLRVRKNFYWVGTCEGRQLQVTCDLSCM
jgi:hypothetical protein